MPSNRPTRSDADFESSLEGSQPLASGADLTPTAARTTRLGRYRIVCELASGGMASVNLAIAEGIEKLLALKIIHPHLAKEPGFVAMFLDEARIASGVAHRNVCSVFDHGEHEGSYYMAMEYLAGRTLREVVRRLRASSRARDAQSHLTLAYVIAQACEGLHAAHELRGVQGELLEVVHRDVSPQNLFVTYDGHVSVIDFGIARAAERSEHTAAGVLKGKFAYMAPEQLRQAQVDRRADVWALGVCLWESLARRRLFARTSQPETLMSVLSGEIPAPSSVDSSVPAALDAIVQRALTRDLDARYQTARELGLDLANACREHGCAVGPLELEALMGELFPEEIVRATQLEQQAKQIAAEERPSAVLLTCIPDVNDGVDSQGLPHACAPAEALNTCEGPLEMVVGMARASDLPAERPQRARPRGSARAWASATAALIALLSWAHVYHGRKTASVVHGLGAHPAAQVSPGVAATQAQIAPAVTPQPPVAPPATQRPMASAPRPHRTATSQPTTHAPSTLQAPSEQPQAQEPAATQETPSAARADAVDTAKAAPNEPLAAPSPAVERPHPLAGAISFSGVRTAGALVPSVVTRMLARAKPLVRSCYLEAVTRAPADVPVSVPIWFTIDESGAVRDGGMGAQARSSLSYCVISALHHVHSDQRPDVGVVHVAAELHFQGVLSAVMR